MDALTAVIVDDDTLARDRLGQLLTDAGVRVLASLPDGLAALAWFRTPGHEADAAFVDIQMPQMDGLTLAQSLTGLPHPPAIVFCTTDEQHAGGGIAFNDVAGDAHNDHNPNQDLY